MYVQHEYAWCPQHSEGLVRLRGLELRMTVHRCVSAGTSGSPAAKVAVCPDQEALSAAKNGNFPLSAGASSLSGASRQLPKECLVVLREFTDSVPFLLLRTCTAIALGSCGLPLCVNEASQDISPPGANQDLALQIPRCS